VFPRLVFSNILTSPKAFNPSPVKFIITMMRPKAERIANTTMKNLIK